MIISHRWRFIFIKGRKVAGTSIEMALSTICGPNDIITPITPRDDADRFRLGGFCQNYATAVTTEAVYREAIAQFVGDASQNYESLAGLRPQEQIYYPHMSLRRVLATYPGDLSRYRVFCVERCPYRKAMSLANMFEKFHRYELGQSMEGRPDTLHRQMDAIISDGTIMRVRNIDLYTDHEGRLPSDVLRYSAVASDFKAFLDDVGAPTPLLPHAKKGLSADSLDPVDMLRPDQIETLNVLLRDDFAAFGYPMIELSRPGS